MPLEQEQGASIRIGPAGFSYPDWRGRVYPTPMPRGVHPLTYLTRFFDTVEMNGTFYRPPRSEHAADWVRRVSRVERFLFTVKLPSGVHPRP